MLNVAQKLMLPKEDGTDLICNVTQAKPIVVDTLNKAQAIVGSTIERALYYVLGKTDVIGQFFKITKSYKSFAYTIAGCLIEVFNEGFKNTGIPLVCKKLGVEEANKLNLNRSLCFKILGNEAYANNSKISIYFSVTGVRKCKTRETGTNKPIEVVQITGYNIVYKDTEGKLNTDTTEWCHIRHLINIDTYMYTILTKHYVPILINLSNSLKMDKDITQHKTDLIEMRLIVESLIDICNKIEYR